METKPVRLTKKHYACYAILSAGRPLTRLETVRLTHQLQVADGCKVAPFQPTSNVSYWLPREAHFCPASRSSFIVQGLLTSVGKRGNSRLYDLTPKGRELAVLTQERLEGTSKPDWRPDYTTAEDHYTL